MKKEIRTNIIHYFIENEKYNINEIINEQKDRFPEKEVCINIDEKKKIGLFYNSNGMFYMKVENYYDLNGHEIEYIEYDKNNEIIQRVEYENYPDGETKWMYVYDNEGNLINKEFFEED